MEYICDMPKVIKPTYGIMVYMSILCRKYCKFRNQKIVFNFTNTKDIDGSMLAVLGLVFTKIKANKNKIFLRGLSTKQKELLFEVKFLNNVINIKKVNSYISYKIFNGDDNNQFRDYIDKEIKYTENEVILNYISDQIMEIFLNIKIHARGSWEKSKFANKEVFSSGFFNKIDNKLVISICNNGKTFSENIFNKNKIEYSKQCDYIKWAFEECNTTTVRRPGGAGLAMVKELILKNKGKLIVCSGKGYYSVSFDQYENEINIMKDMDINFPATAIILEINIDNIKEVYVDEEREFSINELIG